MVVRNQAQYEPNSKLKNFVRDVEKVKTLHKKNTDWQMIVDMNRELKFPMNIIDSATSEHEYLVGKQNMQVLSC